MTFKDYKKHVKARVSEKRFNHSVNVAKEAVKLANRYGADPEKAEIAGILHDITKETPTEEQLQIMEKKWYNTLQIAAVVAKALAFNFRRSLY